MNKNLKLCFGIICLSFVFVSAYMIIKINRQYPEKQVEYISIGESEYVLENIKFRVIGGKWEREDEIIEKYGITNEVPEDIISKTALVRVNLENEAFVSRKIELYNIYIEKDGYCNGLCPELFKLCNKKDMVLDMEPGEKVTLVLPYTVYKSQFTERQWSELDKQKFYLVNQRYPIKICWELL